MVLETNKDSTSETAMDDLNIESDASEEISSGEQSDADDCDEIELQNTFSRTFKLSTEKALTLDRKYILHIDCTKESTPKVCVGLSDNTCEIHSLAESQLNKITVLDSHTNSIINVKFSDSNLLYTGSADGSVKLWDLRKPEKCVTNFEDSTRTPTDPIKPLSSFDVSENNRLLCAGTELFEGDAFLMFWDTRNVKLMGGYWESHTDDITKVMFHPSDNNKLATGSTDGLINIYDLKESSEDDALINSLNTELSVEQLLWYTQNNSDAICCITHTAEVQLWDVEEAIKHKIFHRKDISREIKRKSADHCYISNAHVGKSLDEIFLLAGSNWHNGECVRALNVINSQKLTPSFRLIENKQRLRASWYNSQSELLITGGERGILSVWQSSSSTEEEITGKTSLKKSVKKEKLHGKKPY